MNRKSLLRFFRRAGEKTKIYLDYIFLQDFLIDYLFLAGIKQILHKKTHDLRLLAGAGVGALCSVIAYLLLFWTADSYGTYSLLMALCRVVAACGMLLAALYPVSKKDFLIAAVMLYGMAFLTEGAMRWLRGYIRIFPGNRYSVWMLLGAGVFFYGFVRRFVQMLRRHLHRKHAIRRVRICIGEKCAEGFGFMDSGNTLVEPITKRPVVVIEASFLKEKEIMPPDKGFFMIPFRALGCDKGMLKGFLADRMTVGSGEGEHCYEKVMIGIYEGKLSGDDAYQMLLHPCL